jgi:hypothetical protein
MRSKGVGDHQDIHRLPLEIVNKEEDLLESLIGFNFNRFSDAGQSRHQLVRSQRASFRALVNPDAMKPRLG